MIQRLDKAASHGHGTQAPSNSAQSDGAADQARSTFRAGNHHHAFAQDAPRSSSHAGQLSSTFPGASHRERAEAQEQAGPDQRTMGLAHTTSRGDMSTEQETLGSSAPIPHAKGVLNAHHRPFDQSLSIQRYACKLCTMYRTKFVSRL